MLAAEIIAFRARLLLQQEVNDLLFSQSGLFIVCPPMDRTLIAGRGKFRGRSTIVEVSLYGKMGFKVFQADFIFAFMIRTIAQGGVEKGLRERSFC